MKNLIKVNDIVFLVVKDKTFHEWNNLKCQVLDVDRAPAASGDCELWLKPLSKRPDARDFLPFYWAEDEVTLVNNVLANMTIINDKIC